MTLEAKRWTVQVFIDEHDGSTHAEARLLPADTVTLVGTGTARVSPRDRDVPEIGDELATARALADLAHRLLEAAAGDVEAMTHEDVHLRA
jgi:hypothetical protein